MASTSSSSSSSSGCCNTPYCDGVACTNFFPWTLNGLNASNTDNCTLYITFDVLTVNVQQVEIYKDSGRTLADLVAIGQSSIAGSITLSARNDSGISGNVVWDGTLTPYSDACTISCNPFESASTSSSSSSIDSSSSYSSSSISTYSSDSSSSSSGCCTNWACEGTDCNHFSLWIVNNSSKGNTDNCAFYVAFEFISPNLQQVRLYKDSSYASSALVAAGQDVSGTIVLDQRNSSGLSGSVTWDGTPVYYPSFAILDCEFSSSSSSSVSSYSSKSISSESSSSESSSTSSSSESSESSSSYSESSKSRSSVSSFSSSSSCSLDSSSSSSESVGNTSTSSSSSFGGWNKTKPFILGMSAINSATVLNRLAQTISLVDTTYSIGKVYCYLYPNGMYHDYTIHLDICLCDNSGKPSTIIASQTLAGGNITVNGWYSFAFNISDVTPDNKYMSFVLWQENGDEDNYVLWGYNYADILGTLAWMSNDAVTWIQHEGVARSLKVVGSFAAYDLTDHRILTPPTSISTTVGSLGGGTYDGTKLVNGDGYPYETDKVVIDNPPLLTSFVVDSSGSMGWNDRFNSRTEFVQQFIQKLKSHYPSPVLFDIVKFGALIANTSSVVSGLGNPVTINLDLNSPTRTTYRFAASLATASSGDIYSSNGNSFTVIQDVSLGSVLLSVGRGTPLPTDSGILTKVSGSGDASISYDSYAISSIFDPIVAYGFKNMEAGHTYNIGEIDIGGQFTTEVSLLNWQTLTTDTVPLSVDGNGPNGSDTLDLTTASGMVLRKALSSEDLSTTQLTTDASTGSNVISVLTSGITSNEQYVDVFDKDIASLGMLVANTTATTLTFSNSMIYDVSKWSTNSGLVQVSNLASPVDIATTTAKLLIRDVSTTKNITFFLQTINGLSIEWDFQPFEEWVIYNLYWNDETAILPITIMDADGNPFPDGTKVAMYVGGYPDDSKENQVDAALLTKDSLVGSTRIDLDSTEGYVVGQEIDVVNSLGSVQTVTISSVESTYILISSPLIYNFTVATGSRIVPHTTQDQANAAAQVASTVNLLSASLGFVDATPIYVGKSLNPSLLKPYDPPPVPPAASYSDLLLDRERIRSYSSSDIPTIDGQIFVQILPITEDNLKTIKAKDDESDKIIRPATPPTYTEQLEQNEDDPEQVVELLANSVSNVTTTTTTATIIPKDYDIESPVYLYGGTAQSAMTTYANDYTERSFDGINVPGVDSDVGSVIMAKNYVVYPAIIFENDINGTVLAKQYLSPFSIYFTPSVWIFSNVSCEQLPVTMEQWVEAPEGCDPKSGSYTTSTEYLRGVYADSGNGMTIDYTVTYQGVLANNMTLTVRIYSNMLQNSETLADTNRETPTNQYCNSVLPKSTRVVGSETEEYQPLTDISQWRELVNSNPASQGIEDTNTDQDVQSSGYVNQIISDYENAVSVNLPGNSMSQDPYDPETPTILDGTKFYVNPWEWTKATQYGDYQEQTLNIVNGKATLTIPASDVVATLFVEASVVFGQNNEFESIRADHVAVANPIDIGAISPYNIEAQGGSTKYELGTNVKWYDDVSASTISNISVSLVSERTTCLPSVAKTDSEGYAAGVRIGPHAPVTMTCPSEDDKFALGCDCYGEYEAIAITVSKLAYSRTVVRHIEWIGNENVELPKDDGPQFYFICEVSGSAWADSVSNSGASVITSDMGSIDNDLWVNQQYPYDGTMRIGCGLDQQEETPIPLSPTRIWPFKCVLNFVLDTPRWLPSDCSDIATMSSALSAKIYGVNRNIGNQPILNITEDNPEVEWQEMKPWRWRINVSTYYHYADPDGNRRGRLGTGCVAPGPFTVVGLTSDRLVTPYPIATITEPLSINVTTEAYDGVFQRNGIDSPAIVAEVKWKGQPITNWFTASDGTVIEYPFPQVAFKAGEWKLANGVPSECIIIDNRGKIDDCRSIGEVSGISMTSYLVTASLSRTDLLTEGTGTHTHACTVDKYGNGITTQTIVTSGTYEDHVHNIANYIGLSSGISPHTHTLRCVAVSNLNPTINPWLDLAVNAYAYYDPTNCQPYVGQVPENVDIDTYVKPNADEEPSALNSNCDDPYKDGSLGNRMMFGTVRFQSAYRGKELVFEFDSPTNGWTSLNVTDETKTIGINVSAHWTEYTVEDYPGHLVIIPAQPVADGTRIGIEITAYKPNPQDAETNVMIVRPDAVKDYMLIKVRASAKIEGYDVSETRFIAVKSSLQWLPGKKALFFEPTDDDIYIAQALTQIDTIGASQIHDGVNYAAQRIIDFQTSQTSWKSAKKIIFLLTDGDENSSQYSIAQAINTVNFIDGKCEVPVLPVRLGYSYGADEVLAGKYALDTCGEGWYMINATDSEVQQIIENVVTSDSIGVNQGTYTNTIDLGSSNLPYTIYMRDFVIPTGSRIVYRTRSSTDGIVWSDWSEWYDSSVETEYALSITVIGRYFQYQVKLYGNEEFESPYITAGAIIEYYKAQTFSVFFQPVELDIDTDQYVASIHITHTGTIPETSLVNYGFAQFNTTEIDDYACTTRPLITPDRHTILLTRYNEMFLTQDRQTYTAINGGWPDESTIGIYRVNNTNILGELVNPSTYAVNNKDGKITFYNVRSADDTFVLCVSFDSVFRIIMNAVNYGPESAIIDHIGIMYNVTKRIPKDSLGNIIHMPISMRI